MMWGRRVENLCHLPWNATTRRGVKSSTRPGPNPSTARLDMKTLEELDIVVSIVSTCILHDNIAGGILMFCKLSTPWALCLCDRAVPKPLDFLSPESTQSPVPCHLQYLTANSRCPVTLWSNLSRMGVVEIVFDIIAQICLFNALLLFHTSLNRFMSTKAKSYQANPDTSHRVLRFQLPLLFFWR